MQIGSLSPSKLKRIRLCPARALAPQIDEDYADEDKAEGTLAGTLAHNAAKHWYRPSPEWVAAVKAVADPTEREAAIRSREWGGFKKHPIESIDQAFTIALAEVAGDQELPREAFSVVDARTLFEQIVMFYRRDLLNVVFAERRYKGNLSNGVPVHLIIDLAIDRGGRLEIIDFKTGRIKIEDDEMWNDDQVLMNLLAVTRDPVMNRFPNKSFQFFWVRDGHTSDSISLTGNQLADYEYWLIWQYQHLRDLKPEEAVESTNRFCTSCTRKLKCTKYRVMVAEAMGHLEEPAKLDLNGLDNNEVLERIEKVKLQTKVLEEYDKCLKDLIHHRIDQSAQTEIVGKRLKARKRQMKFSDPDTNTVIQLCAQYGKPLADLLSPRKKAVEVAFEGNQEAMGQLAATTRKGMGAKWVEVVPAGKSKTDVEAPK